MRDDKCLRCLQDNIAYVISIIVIEVKRIFLKQGTDPERSGDPGFLKKLVDDTGTDLIITQLVEIDLIDCAAGSKNIKLLH